MPSNTAIKSTSTTHTVRLHSDTSITEATKMTNEKPYAQKETIYTSLGPKLDSLREGALRLPPKQQPTGTKVGIAASQPEEYTVKSTLHSTTVQYAPGTKTARKLNFFRDGRHVKPENTKVQTGDLFYMLKAEVFTRTKEGSPIFSFRRFYALDEHTPQDY